MDFSVAHTFEPGIIARLAEFPEVKELFGKLSHDCIGGGRSSYTLRSTSLADLAANVQKAHSHSIAFNYLINGASLDGLEQTRSGQRKITELLDILSDVGVDAVTVSSPYLLRLVKKKYPHFKVKTGVFAVIDTPEKARRWEDTGADILCLSAIACNRNFKRLAAIRNAVSCGLQLIVNASCLPNCIYELTHMHILTRSSRSRESSGGFCFDYCFLHCSSQKLADPVYYLKSIWIRPEDLHCYEAIGYNSFKILERSCPAGLLVKRVKAYANRSFDGNLLELVAPVAQIKKQQGTSLMQRLRMIAMLAKPQHIKISSMLHMKKYAEKVILDDFSQKSSPVYIQNKDLDGFLDGVRQRDCTLLNCQNCGWCKRWADQHVKIDESYKADVLNMAERLNQGLVDGSLW